jgi:hypothetical protein
MLARRRVDFDRSLVMRFFLGLVIGIGLTVGALYLHDSPAYGTSQPKLVNWSAFPAAADEIVTRIKKMK